MASKLYVVDGDYSYGFDDGVMTVYDSTYVFDETWSVADWTDIRDGAVQLKFATSNLQTVSASYPSPFTSIKVIGDVVVGSLDESTVISSEWLKYINTVSGRLIFRGDVRVNFVPDSIYPTFHSIVFEDGSVVTSDNDIGSVVSWINTYAEKVIPASLVTDFIFIESYEGHNPVVIRIVSQYVEATKQRESVNITAPLTCRGGYLVFDVGKNSVIDSLTLEGNVTVDIPNDGWSEIPEITIKGLTVSGEGTTSLKGFVVVDSLNCSSTGSLSVEHVVIKNQLSFNGLPTSFSGYMGVLTTSVNVILSESDNTKLAGQTVQFGVTPSSLQPILDAFFTPIGRAVTDGAVLTNQYGLIDGVRVGFIDTINKRVVLSVSDNVEGISFTEEVSESWSLLTEGVFKSDVSNLYQNINSVLQGGVRLYVIKPLSCGYSMENRLDITVDRWLMNSASRVLIDSLHRQSDESIYRETIAQARVPLSENVNGKLSECVSVAQVLYTFDGQQMAGILGANLSGMNFLRILLAIMSILMGCTIPSSTAM